MSKTIEEDAADLGRALLSEVIAGIEVLIERAPANERTDELMATVSELYTLVSASNVRVFADTSAAIIEEIAPEKFKKTYPYLEYMLRKALKRLTKREDGKKFLDAYAESLILDLSGNIITEAEINNAKKMIGYQEEFGAKLLAFYHAATEDSRIAIEEGTGISRKNLEKLISTGEMRLSQLRLVCLVLGLRMKYTVINAEGDETEIFIGGEPE